MGIGYTDIQMLFAQEMAAMFAQMNPELEIGAFVIPPSSCHGPKTMTMYVDGSYGMNAATKHPEAALRFVRFLASKEYGTIRTSTCQHPNGIRGLACPVYEIATNLSYLSREGPFN